VNATQNSRIASPSVRLGTVSRDWEAAAFSALALASVVVLLMGGRDYLVLAFAVLPLFYLLHRPKKALWYALAFIPLAASVNPEAHGGSYESTAAQIYYWAIGLLIVLIPVGLGVARRLRPFSWGRLKRAGIPTSLVILFVVSLAACFQGLRLGSPLSYVLRQFYGVLLFCVSFAAIVLFDRRPFELSRALGRIRWLVLLLCGYTIIFYLNDQNQIGFFKGNVSLFSATLAVYCAGEFLCARRLRSRIGWGVWALLFLVHPILFTSRGAVGLAAIVVLAGVALKTRSRTVKYVMLVGALSFLPASIALNLFAGLSSFQDRYALLERLVPVNVLLDPDAIARISQFDSAIAAVGQHPFLGLGFGSALTWYQPALNMFESGALVDNGYAYILSKMGLLGMLSFAWLAISVLKRAGLPGQNGSELGLWLAMLFQLLYMMVGGIVVHFIYAVWAGVIWGAVYQLDATVPPVDRRDPRPTQYVPSRGGSAV
jgi:hypothetical protein